MIHIVFQYADTEALSKSFSLDEGLKGPILEIKDDFAVGPVKDIYEEAGIEARKEWWRKVLQGNDLVPSVDSGEVNDPATIARLRQMLQEQPEEPLWIWVAPNKHDVSGYYWLVSQLKEYAGRVFLLLLNNLPFINEKGHIFYPVNLSEIPAREFVKAQKLARKISSAEFELDPDEWKRLSNENKMVRLLEGGKKLVQKDEDFYDAALLNFITADWQKASRVIQQFLNKATHTTGDAYLLWRLKELIAAGVIDAQGEIRNMKDFEVKKKQPAPAIAPVHGE